MSEYLELIAQRDHLERKILEARQSEIKQAVAQVRTIVNQFNLSVEDVFGAGKVRAPRVGAKVEPKYRDPETGATWTGRGKAPKWIEGKDRNQFVITA